MKPWRASEEGAGYLARVRPVARRAGVRGGKVRHGIAAVCAAMLALVPGWAAGGPARVVSINLCTDQLAMMLADPGQLLSVSHLAVDPRSSVMVDQARTIAQNRGGAEEVFLMRPDLVLAGTYTARATVDLLVRLGVPVVELPPAQRLADVAGHLRIIGQALGQESRAELLVARFEAGLAALRIETAHPLSAALYYPNGYTVGAGTLADDILAATGFANVGAAAGVSGGGILPLERLVLSAPDLIVTSAPYPATSRSEEILRHPALEVVRGQAADAVISDAEWVCGLPQILSAVEGMARAHRAIRDAGIATRGVGR